MFVPGKDLRKRRNFDCNILWEFNVLANLFVTPGEKIIEDPQFMRGHGTYGELDLPVIYSSVAGTVEKINKLVAVRPFRGRYNPEVGDVVIGRIVDVHQKKWRVEVNACQLANLQLSAVNLPGIILQN
jgi:exosome complex component RRP4